MTENKALITEIFYSIQGEGPNTGIPSIFIRFFGCNLRCKFKGECCDTPYAVLTNKSNSKLYTIKELIKEVNKYDTASHIVFTGGEPMLFQDYIEEFIKEIEKHKCYTYEVETNGTIILQDKYLRHRINQFNLSIKLKSSNQSNKTFDKRRINYNAIKSYPSVTSSYKFVYSHPDDLEEIYNIIKNVDKGFNVWLMPEGVTREDIINNSEEVIEICKLLDWNFSSRLHLLIWDNKKGV